MKHFLKNTYVRFVKYSQSTQNFDRAGKMALPSNSTAITPHMERNNIYRSWLVPMTNNYNSSIRGSLITFLISYREAIKILTVAKWLTVKFGHELILLYNDCSARGIESDFPFAAIPRMQMCVGSSLTLGVQAFGFKDHTGCDVFDLYGVLNGRCFCPFRPPLWQVEVLTACGSADQSNYNFMYLLRQQNSWGINCYLHVLFVMLTFLCFCQEWSIRRIGNAEVEDSLTVILNSRVSL